MLRYLQVFTIGFWTLCLCGCDLLVHEEPARVLSFWTDVELVDGISHVLYINDAASGHLTEPLLDPLCHSGHLIDVPLIDAHDMVLVVKAESGEQFDLGTINLYDPSSGIRIKPASPNSIFVQHDIDDSCTRVRLRW